jgi:rhodanese-related sulfurtransferase
MTNQKGIRHFQGRFTGKIISNGRSELKRLKALLFISFAMVIAIIPLISLAGTDSVNQKKNEILPSSDVTPKEAWKMILKNKGNPNFVILDVRTPKEFFNERIARAINRDFYALNFNRELGKLDHSKTYLVYCRTGPRSAAARKVMFKLGFKKVYNMLGGIVDWKKNNLPVIAGQ